MSECRTGALTAAGYGSFSAGTSIQHEGDDGVADFCAPSGVIAMTTSGMRA